MNRAEAEVLGMFGSDGNWEDYWLGTPSQSAIVNTNSFLGADQRGWQSAEFALRDPPSEGPSDETLFLMRAPGSSSEGSGVKGLDEEYYPVLAGILKAGERALYEERKAQQRDARWRH